VTEKKIKLILANFAYTADFSHLYNLTGNDENFYNFFKLIYSKRYVLFSDIWNPEKNYKGLVFEYTKLIGCFLIHVILLMLKFDDRESY